MCVMLFANPKVYAFLDLPTAISYRQSLQVSLSPATRSVAVADKEEVLEGIDESKLPRVMKRSACLQLYFRRLSEESCQDQQRALAQEWGHDALEAIAHAWGRLLSLVGLRR
jgi:hypothetical protein